MSSAADDWDSKSPKSKLEEKRATYSKFSQQELPGCTFILTPFTVITVLVVVGVTFLTIGGLALAASMSVQEYSVRYDDTCSAGYDRWFADDGRGLTGASGKNCTIQIEVKSDMPGPVYVYYGLTNFYQNHRRYVKSRSDAQLRGESGADLSDCDPKGKARLDGNSSSVTVVPCGLIAWSLFNDTYTLSTPTGKVVEIEDKGIAWSTDVEYKFGMVKSTPEFNAYAPEAGGRQIALHDRSGKACSETDYSDPTCYPDCDCNRWLKYDERFIGWMRTAALPNFRKLWGIIPGGLSSGTHSLTINNNYRVDSFGGTKTFLISTMSWLGGKNDFIGIAYLTVGSLSLCVALAFLLKHLISPRVMGDTSYLSWNKEKTE